MALFAALKIAKPEKYGRRPDGLAKLLTAWRARCVAQAGGDARVSAAAQARSARRIVEAALERAGWPWGDGATLALARCADRA